MKPNAIIAAFVGLSALCSAAVADHAPNHNRVDVSGYHRSDGTYVAPHQRTAPDGTTCNNLKHGTECGPNSRRAVLRLKPPRKSRGQRLCESLPGDLCQSSINEYGSKMYTSRARPGKSGQRRVIGAFDDKRSIIAVSGLGGVDVVSMRCRSQARDLYIHSIKQEQGGAITGLDLARWDANPPAVDCAKVSAAHSELRWQQDKINSERKAAAAARRLAAQRARPKLPTAKPGRASSPVESVMNARCKRGGTVRRCLQDKVNLPVVSDLGWTVKPSSTQGQVIVERALKIGGLSRATIYRWSVDPVGGIRAINGYAMNISVE